MRPPCLSPYLTSYPNTSVSDPLPRSYGAARRSPAKSRARYGVPRIAETCTASVNRTAISMRSPCSYRASGTSDVTLTTLAISVPSSCAGCTTMRLMYDSDPGWPGAGRVRTAAAPPSPDTAAAAADGNASAPAPSYSKPSVASAGPTSYAKDRMAVPLPPAYVALRGPDEPVSRARAGGGPDRKTGRVKWTFSLIRSPAPYTPRGDGDVAAVAAGGPISPPASSPVGANT